jgi:hypothetical protein
VSESLEPDLGKHILQMIHALYVYQRRESESEIRAEKLQDATLERCPTQVMPIVTSRGFASPPKRMLALTKPRTLFAKSFRICSP